MTDAIEVNNNTCYDSCININEKLWIMDNQWVTLINNNTRINTIALVKKDFIENDDDSYTLINKCSEYSIYEVSSDLKEEALNFAKKKFRDELIILLTI